MLKTLAVLLVMFALLLAGCAALGGTEESSGSDARVAMAPQADTTSANYVTKEGSVTVKVPEGTLQAKYEELKVILAANGAKVSDLGYLEYSDRKEYRITVKVTPVNFEKISAALTNLGDVKDISVSLEDVTKQYVDLDTRIRNKEIELERLNGLYNQTANVSDLLAVEREVSRVETELELLKQQKQDLVARVESSTISITVYEEKPATTQLSLSLEGIAKLFFGALSVGVTVIVGLLGFLLPLAIVVAIVWFGYKKIFKSGAKPRKPQHDQIPPPQ